MRYDEERGAVVYEPVKLTQDFRTFDFVSPWEAMVTLPGDEKVHAENVTPKTGVLARPRPRRMRNTLYEQDFYAWANEQAALLPARRPCLRGRH